MFAATSPSRMLPADRGRQAISIQIGLRLSELQCKMPGPGEEAQQLAIHNHQGAASGVKEGGIRKETRAANGVKLGGTQFQGAAIGVKLGGQATRLSLPAAAR